MERQLKDYLPIFIQEYAEIDAIMGAEQVNVEDAWTDAENVMCDQFILDATENGVKRWESILSMKPKGTYTLDERRFNILVKLQEQLPYTVEALRTALTAICGTDGYLLRIDNNKYILTVRLALYNENNIAAVSELLDKMIPANLIISITLFNTHNILSAYTHGYLSQYTHKEVREEIL